MKIRFLREIKLHCVEILAVEYEGEMGELEMNINLTFEAGQEFENVEIDEATPTDLRIWIRHDRVALNVPRDAFEIVEP